VPRNQLSSSKACGSGIRSRLHFVRLSFNPLDSKGNYSATLNNTKLGVDGWAVTFGTARRGLGGLQPHPVPSSLYQM